MNGNRTYGGESARRMASAGTVVDSGLEGVVVGATELSQVDGATGRLTYRGYEIRELAAGASFEEVCCLLLHGELPSRSELADFGVRLAANRSLPKPMLAWLAAAPKDAWPMDVLRTMVSGLAFFAPHRDDGARPANQRAAIDLIAKAPTIVAAWARIRRGHPPIEPLPNLSTAANFLYMRTGRMPLPEAERALETYLVLLADHSFNASTFAARVTASTRADMYGCATSALATLDGDLHGGAPAKVMKMILEVGAPERASGFVAERLARGDRIMGMGHREYRVRDPRAEPLEALAKELHAGSKPNFYAVARAIEDAAQRALLEAKPERPMYANVEFYSAPALSALGLPPDEFTCMFACGRMAGWTAHVLEQLAENRLIRPQATYAGPALRAFVAPGARLRQGHGT